MSNTNYAGIRALNLHFQASKYHDCRDKGIYKYVCCDNNLFTSDTKFDSGPAIPAFGLQ